MALTSGLSSREFKKFHEDTPGKVSARIATAQNRVPLNTCDTTDGVTSGNSDTVNISSSVNHIVSQNSISFDKAGTSGTTGQILFLLNSAVGAKTDSQINNITPFNLTGYEEGSVKAYVYLSSLANVVSVSIGLGSDQFNYSLWTQPVANLTVGWNKVSLPANTPTTVVGNGTNWNVVITATVIVTFTAAGNTLTGILVNDLCVVFDQSVVLDNATFNIGQVNVDVNAVPIAPATVGSSVTMFGSTDPTTYNPVSNLNILPVKIQADGTLDVDVTVSPAAPLGYTNKFYSSFTAGVGATTLTFGFTAQEVTISNDGNTNSVFWDYNGTVPTGTSNQTMPGEVFADQFQATTMKILTTASTSACRVWARG